MHPHARIPLLAVQCAGHRLLHICTRGQCAPHRREDTACMGLGGRQADRTLNPRSSPEHLATWSRGPSAIWSWSSSLIRLLTAPLSSRTVAFSGLRLAAMKLLRSCSTRSCTTALGSGDLASCDNAAPGLCGHCTWEWRGGSPWCRVQQRPQEQERICITGREAAAELRTQGSCKGAMPGRAGRARQQPQTLHCLHQAPRPGWSLQQCQHHCFCGPCMC